MDLCLAVEHISGTRVSRRWWDQEVVYVEGMRTAAQEAERSEGGGGDRWYGDGDI